MQIIPPLLPAEFYTFRCEVTQRMIVEQGVKAVCIEGDFAEVSSLHRYVMGYSSFKDVDAALEPFLNVRRDGASLRPISNASHCSASQCGCGETSPRANF
jgi:hypothetical protein